MEVPTHVILFQGSMTLQQTGDVPICIIVIEYAAEEVRCIEVAARISTIHESIEAPRIYISPQRLYSKINKNEVRIRLNMKLQEIEDIKRAKEKNPTKASNDELSQPYPTSDELYTKYRRELAVKYIFNRLELSEYDLEKRVFRLAVAAKGPAETMKIECEVGAGEMKRVCDILTTKPLALDTQIIWHNSSVFVHDQNSSTTGTIVDNNSTRITCLGVGDRSSTASGKPSASATATAQHSTDTDKSTGTVEEPPSQPRFLSEFVDKTFRRAAASFRGRAVLAKEEREKHVSSRRHWFSAMRRIMRQVQVQEVSERMIAARSDNHDATSVRCNANRASDSEEAVDTVYDDLPSPLRVVSTTKKTKTSFLLCAVPHGSIVPTLDEEGLVTITSRIVHIQAKQPAADGLPTAKKGDTANADAATTLADVMNSREHVGYVGSIGGHAQASNHALVQDDKALLLDHHHEDNKKSGGSGGASMAPSSAATVRDCASKSASRSSSIRRVHTNGSRSNSGIGVAGTVLATGTGGGGGGNPGPLPPGHHNSSVIDHRDIVPDAAADAAAGASHRDAIILKALDEAKSGDPFATLRKSISMVISAGMAAGAGQPHHSSVTTTTHLAESNPKPPRLVEVEEEEGEPSYARKVKASSAATKNITPSSAAAAVSALKREEEGDEGDSTYVGATTAKTSTATGTTTGSCGGGHKSMVSHAASSGAVGGAVSKRVTAAAGEKQAATTAAVVATSRSNSNRATAGSSSSLITGATSRRQQLHHQGGSGSTSPSRCNSRRPSADYGQHGADTIATTAASNSKQSSAVTSRSCSRSPSVNHGHSISITTTTQNKQQSVATASSSSSGRMDASSDKSGKSSSGGSSSDQHQHQQQQRQPYRGGAGSSSGIIANASAGTGTNGSSSSLQRSILPGSNRSSIRSRGDNHSAAGAVSSAVPVA